MNVEVDRVYPVRVAVVYICIVFAPICDPSAVFIYNGNESMKESMDELSAESR